MHSPFPSYHLAPPSAYQHALFHEPLHVHYDDGPFVCKDPQEETCVTEAGPGEAETKDTDVKEYAIKEAGAQESVKEEVAPVAEGSLKRKAVELDSQSSHVLESPDTSPHQLRAETSPETPPAGAIDSVVPETEPPRKRAKSNHSPTSTAASYTATAVISALLGGLGTIALLASLPPEYFQ